MFKYIDFSKPYLFVRTALYARADDKRFEGSFNFDDFNKPDYTFAGIEGDSSLIYAKLLFPAAKAQELPQLSDTAQMFQELDSGKADLAIVEPAVAVRAIANNPGRFRRVNFSGKLPEYGAAFGFSKNEPKLKDTISETIDYLSINGIIDQVLDKYDPKKEMFLRVSKPYEGK
jgi:ABC-type amino acid transport substrate-binding protein